MAFTLAEVLITLGIIGVVAAITMPVLVEKHQKIETVSKLKKVYSSLSQMLLLSNADNGPANEFLSDGVVVTKETTEEFFNKYWLPYFNGAQVITEFSYDNCLYYINRNMTPVNLGILTDYSRGRILFSTADGMTIYVNVMKWASGENADALYSTNQWIYVDINGIKGPNQFGRDVFILSINYDKNIVQPNGAGLKESQINGNCSKTGTGERCLAKIINDGWQIKDDYPW